VVFKILLPFCRFIASSLILLVRDITAGSMSLVENIERFASAFAFSLYFFEILSVSFAIWPTQLRILVDVVPSELDGAPTGERQEKKG
jgi:hypothetical protein